MHKKFSLKIRYSVGQCILRSKEPFVRGDIAQHFAPVMSRPLNLDGQGLIHAILNPVLWLPRLIELDPLGVPAECRVLNHCQQLSHVGVEVSYDADTLKVGGVKSALKLLQQCLTNLWKVR